MKRKQQDPYLLIFLAILASPFVWLHSQIGWAGIGILVIILLGLAIFWHLRSRRKDQDSFDELALHVFQTPMHWKDEQRLNHALAKRHFPRAALIRNLQIMRDSIEIALTSRKRETAESRMNTLLELFQVVQNEQQHLMKPETFGKIAEAVKKVQEEFRTKLSINLAKSHLEKLPKLKTAKSQTKYISLAKDALKEAFQANPGQLGEIEEMLRRVDGAEKELSLAPKPK